MPLRVFTALAFLGWAELNLQAQVRAPAPAPVAITHVTVIAMTGAESPTDQTVLIKGGRIVAVGSTSQVAIPPGTRRIDGHGAFVIPGLWDMHVHLAGDRETRRVDFPLFIANGVTGIRVMWGDCTSPCASDNPEDTAGFAPLAASVRAWKRDLASGILLGPRLVAASNVLDGPKPSWPGTRAIHDTTDARQAVEDAARKGADFIKIYDGIQAGPYLTVLRTARALGLPVVGHLPQVSLVTASDSGQKGLEHLAGILRACSRDSAGVAAARARYVQDTVPASKWTASRIYAELMVATFDEKACAPTFAHFVRNKTWQTPTLTVTRSFGLMSDSSFRADRRVRYTPPRLRARWEPGRDFRLRGVTADYYTSFQKILEGSYRAVLALHRAGVPILAGSDVRNAYVFPGFGLHDELALLVAAGLTPYAALEAATVAPARFFGATDSLGSVEPGKVADLVLLAGNPLQSIRNTQRILAVVNRGLYLDRAALDRLLASAEQAAQQR